jgi:cell division protein FtsW (lipid II flippase)
MPSQLPPIVVLVLGVALTSMQTDFGQATPFMRTIVVLCCLAFLGLTRAYKIN